ncbi:hypothetical protein CO046_02685 [Candidatus Peregrinibacteria bacterium CG_4_9_14_0_2_um_filter_53_11]|nr:MAG: hypothetical protein CO046_02685 [Candidatus Peregrinibacteria bacterium CG_4_9_14_0_2_um_filter_53_11]
MEHDDQNEYETLRSEQDPSGERETSRKVLRGIFGAKTAEEKRALIKKSLLGIPPVVALILGLFYWRFGLIPPIGIGVAVFMTVFLLLTALATYASDKTHLHSEQALQGSLADKIGAFWLVSVVFGPFFAWVVGSTNFFTLETTQLIQFILSALLPVVCVLPLLSYVTRKNFFITLPILFVITGLAVYSHWSVVVMVLT